MVVVLVLLMGVLLWLLMQWFVCVGVAHGSITVVDGAIVVHGVGAIHGSITLIDYIMVVVLVLFMVVLQWLLCSCDDVVLCCGCLCAHHFLVVPQCEFINNNRRITTIIIGVEPSNDQASIAGDSGGGKTIIYGVSPH